MKREHAEEYTQALGQVVAGGWRQIALGERLGVPRALGLTTRDWVEQRLGGYVRLSLDERLGAVKELKAEGLPNTRIADVLGVGEATVRRDSSDGEPRHLGPAETSRIADMPSPNDEPIDAMAALAVGEMREKEARKLARVTQPPKPPDPPSEPTGPSLRIAYADPPYPGQAERHYGDEPDYAGEVDHAELLQRLERDYDGWCLHTSTPALRELLLLSPLQARVMAWVKPFAAFKRNIPVAYAWEPVLVKACRKPQVTHREVMRDWISEPITLERGLVGAKPQRVCWWLFEVLGMSADDDLDDLYPGTGAVTAAWEAWRAHVRSEVA